MKTWLDGALLDWVELVAGFAFKSENFQDSPTNGVPLIKGENVGQGHIHWNASRYWPACEYREFEKFHLRSGDVIVAMDRPWVPAGLKWAYIRDGDPNSLLVQRCARLRTKSDKLDQGFLRFVIGGPSFEGYVKPITTGVNVPHISGEQILRFRLQLPPVDVQHRIVGILSAYDDLIENCKRRIRVLDEMARALYREWFVLFRYPGHEGIPLVESEIGPMPRGWEASRAAAVAHECRRSVPKGPLDGPTPYVGLEHIPRRSLALNAWEDATAIGSNKLRFEAGQVLFGKIRPYFHKVAVAPFDGVCSADTFVISPLRGLLLGFTVGLVSSDDFVAHASATANGAKMPRANWSVMMSYPIALAPDALLMRFNGFMEPILAQQRSLILQVTNLRRTRDLLLPRLLSGQIDLDDAV